MDAGRIVSSRVALLLRSAEAKPVVRGAESESAPLRRLVVRAAAARQPADGGGGRTRTPVCTHAWGPPWRRWPYLPPYRTATAVIN